MTNNDVLRSIRYLLDLADEHIVALIKLADASAEVDKEDVAAWLRKDVEPGYIECDDRTLALFLDGLVVHQRGRDETTPLRPTEKRMTNNLVLKKLRIAFELKDVDMHSIFAEAGFAVSKPELSAVFRQPEHKNYRVCGDQMLRNFLKGLTLRLRGN